MLKKPNRLISNFEFNVVKKYGKKYRYDSFFATIVKPTNYTGPVKIGFVIANHLEKSAAKRNKIKRVFREVVRNHIQELPVDNWISLVANSNTINKSYEEVNADFAKFLQEISISK